MQVFWPWFMVAQAALVPLLAAGTEVRLVSPDLLEVYAFGTVENGALMLEGDTLLAGTDARLLILPPEATSAERASAAVAADVAGTPAPVARVVEDDVIVVASDGRSESLRVLLADQGIEVFYPGEADR